MPEALQHTGTGDRQLTQEVEAFEEQAEAEGAGGLERVQSGRDLFAAGLVQGIDKAFYLRFVVEEVCADADALRLFRNRDVAA